MGLARTTVFAADECNYSGDSDVSGHPLCSRLSAIGAALLWCALGVSPSVLAESASAPALKAAFLFNFVKFSEWPPDALPAGGPVILCVADDPPLADALQEIVKNQSIDGHSLVVRRQAIDASMRSCHLVYASGLDSRRSTQLIDLLKDAPVLSVSDVDQFAPLGGVAQFFTDHGKMRFAVNLQSMQRAHLRLSSRLLSLATIAKDARSGQP
jgi:hypothetical protein